MERERCSSTDSSPSFERAVTAPRKPRPTSMIAFESLDVAYGWKLSGTPDEVSVVVAGDDASEEVWGR